MRVVETEIWEIDPDNFEKKQGHQRCEMCPFYGVPTDEQDKCSGLFQKVFHNGCNEVLVQPKPGTVGANGCHYTRTFTID